MKFPWLNILSQYFISKELADEALSYYDNKYINTNGVEYIAVIKTKNPIFKYKLEFGLSDKRIKRVNETTPSLLGLKGIPSKLKIESKNKDSLEISIKAEKYIYSKIKYVNEIKFLPKQMSKKNEKSSISTYDEPLGGTFGAMFRLNEFNGYFGITNWHVFYPEHDRATTREYKVGQEIYYPRSISLNTSNKMEAGKIGKATWYSNNNVDVSIFSIIKENYLPELKLNIPILSEILRGTIGLKVTFSGLTTKKGTGKIRSNNVTIKIREHDFIYRNQIQLERISTSGDSGAVLFNNYKGVGLLFASNKYGKKQYSYANCLTNIFETYNHENKYFIMNDKSLLFENLTLKKDNYVYL